MYLLLFCYCVCASQQLVGVKYMYAYIMSVCVCVCVCKEFSESLITRIKIVCTDKMEKQQQRPIVRYWQPMSQRISLSRSQLLCNTEREGETESGFNTFSLLSHALIVAELPLFFLYATVTWLIWPEWWIFFSYTWNGLKNELYC